MAISPPGDIVLDVIKAADPTAVETARARLASLSGPTAADAGAFATQATRTDGRATPSAPGMPSSEAFVKFEAMVLQSFFQSMMPQDTSSVYGEGLSGEMWQNLFAEQLGNAVSKRGGIGIADRILRDYYVAGEKRVSMQGVSNDPDRQAQETEQMLSVALVQELQRKAAQSLSQDGTASSAANSQ